MGGGQKIKANTSLESTVASEMKVGGLGAQEGGRLVRSCMFGSIQYVYVVNMNAGFSLCSAEADSEEKPASNSAQ